MMKNIILISAIFVLYVTTSLGGPVLNPTIKKTKLFPVKGKVSESAVSKNEHKVTDEEKEFLKIIEEKYNVKKEDDEEIKDIKKKKVPHAPLPAVIAIEIFNDNSTDGKGKRTIDANLGYGYKTNNGYIYSQFGSANQEKGKFMIYPYSQHDIPPISGGKGSPYVYHTQALFHNSPKTEKTHVEIQPSKAYQLVPVDSNEDHESSYSPVRTFSRLRTKYEQVEAVETPPPPQYHSSEEVYNNGHAENPTTLYSTFNGGQLSDLSGHFPVVMPNYFVSPSQILSHPQYQSLGIQGQEHLPQRNVIPVLILRIPSSHIQNPTADLYPKLPHNHPYAMSLNNINIQSLVSEYLANLQQPQYVQPTEETQPKYVVPYSPPVNYQYQHQQVYSVPNTNSIHYAPKQPLVQHYLPSSQPTYLHQSPTVQQPSHSGQSIKYVIPHPSQSSNSQGAVSHSSFSQVYGPISHQQPEYENHEEQSQHLTFSENYPDSAHTQVVYQPQYQSSASGQSLVHTVSGQSGYVTPSSQEEHSQQYTIVSPTHTPGRVHQTYISVQPDPASSHEQEDTYENEQSLNVSEESADKYETPSPSKVPPQVPHNYHAHPYPKRQIKTSDKEIKKNNHQRRRVMS